MAEIVPSEELRAFVLRFYATWVDGDVDTLREMFSTNACMKFIGTDPNEWLSGAEAIAVLVRQTMELRGIKIKSNDLKAFACSGVGWAADNPEFEMENGTKASGRLTFTMAIERGHWRIVQYHVSIGLANQDTFNMTLTTSIDAIERSVRDDRPDMRRASAPDGTVTILFTDIESSTVLMERLGDAEFMRMLAWHDQVIRDVSDEHRGFVVKSQGDGFMLAFPSAAFALRAALVIRGRIAVGFNGLPVRVRAGLHAGEAIKHDDDFYGRTVVIAARISALALGGEILASDLVHALAGSLGTFSFGEPRTVTLKGLDGEFRVREVLS